MLVFAMKGRDVVGVFNGGTASTNIYPFKPSGLFVGHRQTVQTRIRRRKSRRLIKVSTVCLQNVP